ncbi:MAG TPA: ABC transporter ATP-binding protein [Syntrophomonas sp.]|mgnify:CR=1 FL=1|nr:ABC transporter ATP-binding protein [Syntrophomonas sp.]HRW13548.1 ABC transporter ATP-binding protein [Syntrophomonas sp.]
MTVMELDKISFRYEHEEWLFNNMSLTIEAGESICLLGANGSGKSTLLKLFCGLVFPSTGIYRAFEQEITEDLLEDNRFAQGFHRRIGFIFQNSDAQLFTSRVWDEVAFGPLQMGFSRAEVKRRVDDVLVMLNLQNLAGRSPHRLSGGEKKKVAVASTLVLNPEVIILDEPTNGLDPKTQRWMVELLMELNKHGRTIITSTHNLDLAHAISQRALVLSEEHCLIYDGDSHKALEDKQLLMAVNLIDEYCHVHGESQHSHLYKHG